MFDQDPSLDGEMCTLYFEKYFNEVYVCVFINWCVAMRQPASSQYNGASSCPQQRNYQIIPSKSQGPGHRHTN